MEKKYVFSSLLPGRCLDYDSAHSVHLLSARHDNHVYNYKKDREVHPLTDGCTSRSFFLLAGPVMSSEVPVFFGNAVETSPCHEMR